jgi:glucose/arabinose dehydrogenase
MPYLPGVPPVKSFTITPIRSVSMRDCDPSMPQRGSEEKMTKRILGFALLGLCATAGGWAPDLPDQSFVVSPAGLPAPTPEPDPDTLPPKESAWPAGKMPSAPQGFTASIFARMPDPNWMAVAPNGDVFISQVSTGKVLLLRGSGSVADEIVTFAEGFQSPHGLALHNGWLYVSDTRSVWRVAYAAGAVAGGRRQLVASVGPADDKAIARDMAFDSKGAFYWGFATRHPDDPAPDGSIERVAPDGKLTIFASGLHTVAGLAVYPGTNRLFAAADERRGLGPGLVPDYLTHIEAGGFYGSPYAYIGSHPDPVWGPKRPDMVAKGLVPDLLFEAGSAPLGIAFYDAHQFPPPYRGGAFVVLHGSWKLGVPVGYKVAFVPFHGGMPSGGYKNFVTGFVAASAGDKQPEIYGRPTAVAIARDGGLLISDNIAGIVWRVIYTGK